MNRAITADDLRIAGEAREFETGRVLQAAVIAAAIAACLNLVVYFAARAAGVAFTGRFSPTAPETVVAMTDVLGASIVWVILAIIGLLVFNRFTARPSKVFTIVATTFGLLSVAGPLTFPEATAGTKLALTMMHLILTAAIVGALVVRGRAPRRA